MSLEGVDAVTVMMQHEIEAEAERKGARQRSTLDEMFTGERRSYGLAEPMATGGPRLNALGDASRRPRREGSPP
jgi:hypothetical protein